MEATVITPPPFPTPAQLADARQVVSNPARFSREPDFQSLCAVSWNRLLVDHWERMEARKIAAAIRSTMPDDAA